jgi:TolB-like protein
MTPSASPQTSQEAYRIADLVLDVGGCAVTRGDTPIALPPRTFELLVELARRYPNVARRRDLIDSLWRGEDVLDEVLSQRVMLLRKALGDTAARPRYIALVRGWGYKLAAPAVRVDRPPAFHAGGTTVRSVAVFPFLDISPGHDQEYLCDGIAEEVINALTRIRGLRVIARTSSFVVGGMGLDVREAGARLGVEAILEGSVCRDGQRIRVTAQLVSTADGGHLRSERYDREMTDVLSLQDDIAVAIAESLRLDLTGRPGATARPAVDAEAQTAYLEGRHHLAKGTPEALARAGACFERAVASNPGFALAYDSLAELHWYLGFFGGAVPRDAFSLSTWHALRALELDDGLAQTHALLGMLRKELDYNWPEVDRELARAIELEPQSPAVRLRHAISGLLPHGRMREATAEVEEVLRSDPYSLLVRWWLAVMTYLDRQPERMAEEGRRMIALDPGHFLGHWVIGAASDELGAGREAVRAFDEANRLSGGIPFTLGFLAFANGRAGERAEARRLLEAAAGLAERAYVPPTTFLMAHVGLGDWDEVLRWADAAIEARDPIIIPIKTFPFLDPIREDRRFRVLLEKMRLG